MTLKVVFASVCALTLGILAPAQTLDAPQGTPAPPAKYGGWTFSGMADGYVTANFNHPLGNSNQVQNFDINYGQPELSLAKFTVDKSDQVLGLHVDAGFGGDNAFHPCG